LPGGRNVPGPCSIFTYESTCNSINVTNKTSIKLTLSPHMPSPKRQKTSSTSLPFSPGELGKLAHRFSRELALLGWHKFFQSHRQHSSINTTLHQVNHDAAPYLARLARFGVPAPSTTAPWPLTQRDQAVRRGPHPSAARHHTEFLLEDMYDYVRMGYWLVLPYSAVRHLPQLKLAPSGVVPQRDRRPRPIMDYSYNAVNQSSAPVAPQHAMQFGHALQRILQRLAYCNPAFGPPLLAKIDLADGYYRIPLSPQAALTLAVVLPPDNHNEPLIGLPLSLPMGWGDSPPYFCAFTETCADLANDFPPPQSPSHPLTTLTQTSMMPQHTHFHHAAAFPRQATLPDKPLAYTR
jgi:hypothetical protein